MKNLFLGLLLVVTLQACSEKVGVEAVADTNWILIDWPGQTMPNTTKKATLNFSADNKISGKSFCNGFGGAVVITGNAIKFSQLIGTMMFCEDVGTAEKNYTDGLASATNFKVVNGKLQLLNGDKLLMVFRKAE